MEWTDVTSYSRGDKERTPTAFQATLGGLRIAVVSSHINCPGEWVMHCDPFYNTYPLSVDTKEEAMEKALRLVSAKIKQIQESIDACSPTTSEKGTKE